MRVELSVLMTCWLIGLGIALSGFESAGVADDPADVVPADDATVVVPADEDDALPNVGADETAPFPLNQIVDIDLEDATFRELGVWITAKFNVPVEFVEDYDHVSADWPSDVRLIANGHQQRLYTILKRALQTAGDDVERECIVRDGVVVIGPTSELNDQRRIVHYDVSDLLDGTFDVDSLKKLLQWSTDGEWVDIDGIGGHIDHYRGLFIIDQTDRLHQELAHILAALRHPRVPELRIALEDDVEIERRLQQPVSLWLSEVDFDDAITGFMAQSGVPVRILHRQFLLEGFSTDLPVSVAADQIPAESVLNALLDSYANCFDKPERDGLVWYPQGGEIVINVPYSDERVFYRTYSEDGPGPVVAVDHGTGERPQFRLFDVSDLVSSEDEQLAFNEVLMSQSSEEWVELDGLGGEILVLEPGWIMVRHTSRALDEIHDLLDQWRSMGLNDPARTRFPSLVEPDPTGGWIRETRWLMHEDTAADLLRDLPQRFGPGTWKDADHPDAVGTISMVRVGMVEFTRPVPQTPSPSGDSPPGAPGGDTAQLNVDDPVDPDATDETPAEPAEPQVETIEFPAAILIIEQRDDVSSEIFSELFNFTPDSWTTYLGESRVDVPIQVIDGGGFGGFGGGGGGFGGFGGGGFFQVP